MSYKEMRDIVVGKLIDRTVDDDYEELSERLFGEGNCFSSTEVRKRMYGMKAIIEALEKDREADGSFGKNVLTDLDEKKIELQKERQRFFDQRNALNKLIRERARQEELNDIIRDAISVSSLPVLGYEPREVERSDNDLLVSLNDIHYGADILNHWNFYNSDVCREAMSDYLDKIISIKKTHNSENCIVWANGDLISGNIHYSIAVTNKENVIEQVTGVSELISEFLAELSKHFATVKYVSVSGNHSRIDTKDQALKDERIDDLVEWYLKARLQGIPNIQIGAAEKLDETMYIIDVRGKTYCGVHGDYEGSDAKVQSLVTMSQREVYAILSAHKHHNKIDTVQGVKVIMAGSFIGISRYESLLIAGVLHSVA
jgi:hypothetical protein